MKEFSEWDEKIKSYTAIIASKNSDLINKSTEIWMLLQFPDDYSKFVIGTAISEILKKAQSGDGRIG